MKGAGKSSEKNAKPTNFYPKILLIGNKKDLKQNKDNGVITKDDIEKV